MYDIILHIVYTMSISTFLGDDLIDNGILWKKIKLNWFAIIIKNGKDAFDDTKWKFHH